MDNNRAGVVVVLVLVSCLGLCTADDPWIINSVQSAMNTTVDPCEDFYSYACGGWISATKLPADKSRFDRSFSLIEKHNKDILLQVLNSASTDPKLSVFYQSCMDISTINALGATPIQTLLTIASVATDLDLLSMVTGIFHSRGIASPLFGLYTTIDAKDPSTNIAGFAQGGLNLPYAGLYTSTSNDSVAIQQAYVKHMTNMFILAGEPAANASQDALAVMAFETAIAKFTLPPDQLVDPFKTYNKLNVTGLQEIAPQFHFDTYLDGLGLEFNAATVDSPPFFSNLSTILMSNQKNWAPYMRWHVIHHYATRLSQEFVDENFAFYGKLLNGQEAQSPRSDSCIDFTDGALGELLGKYFTALAFPGKSLQTAVQILKGIEGAMKQDLQTIDWMDDVTRQKALDKLALVANMIAGPSNPKNYSNVDVLPNQFFENAAKAEISATMDSLSQIEQPSNRNEWDMTAQTVNAYYDPTRNQMVFPAGILQTPYFNLTFPLSMNTGGIGMVMGHELTHGFDNQGRDYDGTGKLVNWWAPATSKKFDDKVQCVIDQYSHFEVLPGLYINGQLTQGENIADMGGIKNSYHSYITSIGTDANSPSIVPGLSNIELFFVAFAQGWCEKATDEALRVQVETNPHSPAKFRVLGPLINLPEFSSTFECKPGSYMNPANRCQVW